MKRPLFKWPVWLVLAVSVATTSCDQTPSPTESLPTPAPAAAVTQSSYTLVHDDLKLGDVLGVSAWIGIKGGKINCSGHILTVPAGAVKLPTLFTMTLVTDGYIKVDLRATVTDLLGRVVDVGSLGFKQPVSLTLTYKRSPDNLDPSRLLIVYLNGTLLEPVPSKVDPKSETVTATLSHFSKYAMATN
jgi:hypothetical protein